MVLAQNSDSDRSVCRLDLLGLKHEVKMLVRMRVFSDEVRNGMRESKIKMCQVKKIRVKFFCLFKM